MDDGWEEEGDDGLWIMDDGGVVCGFVVLL
jgi:hypothetical protein